MKKIFLLSSIAIIAFASCKKDEATTDDFTTLKTTVLADFTNTVAVPGYLELDNNAAALKLSIENLSAATTEANLTEARTAWKNMRATWEKCEGYLLDRKSVV